MTTKTFLCAALLASALPCAAQGENPVASHSMDAHAPAQVLDLRVERMGQHPRLLTSVVVSAREGREHTPFSITRDQSYAALQAGHGQSIASSVSEGVAGVLETPKDQPASLILSVDTIGQVLPASDKNSGSVAQTQHTQIALVLEQGMHTQAFEIEGVPYQVVADYQVIAAQ